MMSARVVGFCFCTILDQLLLGSEKLNNCLLASMFFFQASHPMKSLTDNTSAFRSFTEQTANAWAPLHDH